MKRPTWSSGTLSSVLAEPEEILWVLGRIWRVHREVAWGRSARLFVFLPYFFFGGTPNQLVDWSTSFLLENRTGRSLV